MIIPYNYFSAALHALISRIPADIVKFVLLKKVSCPSVVRVVQRVLAFNQKQGAL